MAGTPRGANDPGRRDRILQAALTVIADHGVHATTHRRIAAEADVPLGSLTYYFDDLPTILREAFGWIAARMSDEYQAAMAAAPDRAAAAEAVADQICGTDYADRKRLVLLYEMYSYAHHDEAVARITRDALHRSHASLALHFPPAACRAIDALNEGWAIHRSFDPDGIRRDEVVATILAVAERF